MKNTRDFNARRSLFWFRSRSFQLLAYLGTQLLRMRRLKLQYPEKLLKVAEGRRRRN